ncbi:protein kinase ATM/Tel1 [Pseudocercospora fijiensis CIRAD86]|uniref:Serine/threonine-protein kinase Tel1 n=1 Tax=Pseudocercospora fijiensis (strain CIRAD86) TaxID=383855 RepID=M3ARA3_PSEFD|nr:protein kinase ATM/Tel1 [Pseudocercospora fijiensis CIRAD86]EME87131.1 protein kinase ATM/Tel1 [Pseudocercospora fijiensis CIRAD86]
MASVSLRDALEGIQSGAVKARSDGIRDLKHILDYNRNSARIGELRDGEYNTILETLYNCADKEKRNALNGKTATARTSASNKLADISNALRHTIEASVQVLKPKTISALLNHIQDTIFIRKTEFCMPVALDYVKSMRAVFEYQPHVVSLQEDGSGEDCRWDALALFCMDCISKIEQDQPSDGDLLSTAGTTNGFSVRSSRSVVKESAGSQGGRPSLRPIAEEMVACIRYLTAVPTVPLKRKAEPLLWTIIEALQKSTVSHKSWAHAFAAINNIICWSRTEDINCTRKFVSHIVKMIRHLWRSNVTKDATCQMLVTLLLLEPYILLSMQQSASLTLRPELTGLLHGLQADYNKRKEREQLRLDDLRLEINPRNVPHGKVATPLLTLRCLGLQTESNWLVVHIMAFLHRAILPRSATSDELEQASEREEEADISQRPRKRQRTEDDFTKLVSAITFGTQQERTCALQTVAFLAPRMRFSFTQLRRLLDSAAVSCSDENGVISSWAYITCASCASQINASDRQLSARFSSIWQLALRSISNPSSSRAASFSLFVLFRLRRVSSQHVTELLQITESMDLNGPSQMSDGAICLLSVVLEASQELSPAAGTRAADAAAGWLSRCFTPSRLEDKHYTGACNSYDSSDVLSLITSCDEELITYLLLASDEGSVLDDKLLSSGIDASITPKQSTRPSVETLLMSHLSSELSRTIDTFTGLVRSRQVTMDAFNTLCKACVSFMCASTCVTFRDSRKHEQLHQSTKKLLGHVQDFVATPSTDQDKADIFLSVFTSTFPYLRGAEQQSNRAERSGCQMLACATIKEAMTRRQSADIVNGDDDFMDLDETFDSQDSRPGQNSIVQAIPYSDLDAAYSLSTLRSSSMLYSTAAITIQNQSTAPTAVMASTHITDFILELPVDAILSCRDVISSLPSMGLVLGASDTTRLMTLYLDLLAKSTYKASEVAMGSLLDVMLSLLGVWTDPHNRDAHNLGLDAYEWLITVAVPKELVSHNVVKRLMNILIQLFKIDAKYGLNTEANTPRLVLFELLKTAPVTAQFELTDRIPEIFGLYVLSQHETIFDELLHDLMHNQDWFEGTVIRLRFFAKLGSSWPSLLRRCVWLLFDSAGNIKDASAHAKICISQLASALPLRQPRVLFTLFAPQLLWSWTGGQLGLEDLPFEAFEYDSVHDLLRANESEALAQITLQGNEKAMDVVTRAVRMMARDAVKRSYAKCLAYCMAYDVSNPREPGAKSNPSEERLREAIGGRVEHQKLLIRHFPAIVGHFYLLMKTDDVGDTWLAKRDGYAEMAKALKDMKVYSHSERSLPETQDPCVSDRYLPDELERLYKRTQLQVTDLWSPSSFSLTARMLVNEIDESLGSLHTCLIIRRLRIFIAMSGELATDGFGLEMLIHSLRPFVSDSECADDALGVLQYLFNSSRSYLRGCLPFATGAIILLILTMRKHTQLAADRTTQESQRTATIEKMISFQKWLVDCLAALTREEPDTTYKPLLASLRGIQLPGNGRLGSSESKLLLFLLDQWRSGEPLCSRQDILEALALLAEGFIWPDSLSEDCLGLDKDTVHYVQPLWEVLNTSALSDKFVAWAGEAIGRAYACTGIRPEESKGQEFTMLKELPKGMVSPTTTSNSTIIKHICQTLYSRKRSEAGLAEFTLRKIQESFASAGDSDEAVEFSQLLPDAVCAAICDGTFGWNPTPSQLEPDAANAESLRQALEAPTNDSIDQWASRLAKLISAWSANNAIVYSLAPLVQNINGLAVQLLPSMIHICLHNELNSVPSLRQILSEVIGVCMPDESKAQLPKQKFFLEILLYLRSQELPGEATKADRLNWLDVDFVVAAGAASRCRMPACALLLAESAAPVAVPQPNRRSTSRASTSQLQPAPIPEELQMAIYQQIDEPDSFYGVSQPATIDSVLQRLDHEQDGFRSLMFRSAQMDSHMRHLHRVPERDAVGMVQSLSALNFNSLAFAMVTQGLGDLTSCAAPMLNAAQTLQQWDISVPDSRSEALLTFSIHQELSRASDLDPVRKKLRKAVLQHITNRRQDGDGASPTHVWCSALASLTEIGEVISSSNEAEMVSRWRVMQNRQDWMQMARFQEVKPFLANRQTLFGVIRQNAALQKGLHLDERRCRAFEVEALLASSGLAREHSQLQDALTATATLSDMIEHCSAVNLRIAGAVKLETATVLSEAGEMTISVKMLKDTLGMSDLDSQELQVGRAGLLAQLGHQMAEARLEKPEDILDRYLTPAVNELHEHPDQKQAGKVYHELASFCDKELQNPGNVENLNRITKLRQAKEEEIEAYNQAIQVAKRSGGDRTNQLNRSLVQAKTWLAIDRSEEQRLQATKQQLVSLSLQNYLRALANSDAYDLSVLRFFAMWLENTGDMEADKMVARYLPRVSSWKFVRLMNQLMTKLEDGVSSFQQALGALMLRIFKEHPYHSINHLFAACQKPKGTNIDSAAQARYSIAMQIQKDLQSSQNGKLGEVVKNIFRANLRYKNLADRAPDQSQQGTKVPISEVPEAGGIVNSGTIKHLPPITLAIPLRPSGDYDDVPKVAKFGGDVSIMGGLSAPKMLKLWDTAGKEHKQLFKSGKDDLRQDAIMEQVFEEVSNMLRNHKATRQRDLKVRTYKVITLAKTSGVIEFVPNSIPLNDFLRPAHKKYYPADWNDNQARTLISNAWDGGAGSQADRIKAFQKVCSKMHPVMRHFFFERFTDPDEWFQKRTAYTRTTASVSILGHIIGLGDRHCSNILLDEKTGEVVHIDLGVAFEAGRVLTIPELIPFRLTRDIVDGMGVTKTEGVFRRCCEFTLDAVREDKESIMTLLNVLRYDPLVEWSVSPLRAKRMQEESNRINNGMIGGDAENSSKKRAHSAGEADRALAIVEKKLAKTMSTTATVNELIQQASDEKNLALLFQGWAAFF